MNQLFKYIMMICCFFTFIIANELPAKTLSDKFITFQVAQDASQIYVILASTNDQTRELHVINSATGALIKNITLPLIAEFSWFKPNLAVTPDGKKVYVIDLDKQLYLVDVDSGKVEQINNKPKQDVGIEGSSAMVLSPNGKRLYIADDVQQMHSPALLHVLDTSTNKMMTTVEGDKGWWHGLSVLDANASHLYISNQIDYRHNEISVLDTKTLVFNKGVFKIDDTIESLVINPLNGWLYATSENLINVIDPSTGKVIDKIFPDNHAYHLTSIVFSSSGNKFYVLNETGGVGEGVIIYDTLSKKSQLIKLPIGFDHSELKSDADGSKIYACDGKMIHIIDTTNDTIIRDLNVV